MGMKVGSAALSYIFLLSLSNTLDIGALGLFLFAYTVFTVLVQVSKSGVDLVLIKAVAASDVLGDVRGVFLSNLLLIFLGSFLLSLMFFLASWWGVFDVVDDRDKVLGFSLVLLSVVVVSVVQVFGAFFQSRYKVVAQYWAMNVGMMAFLSIVLIVCFILEIQLGFLDVCVIFLLCALLVILSVLFIFYFLFWGEINHISSRRVQEKQSLKITLLNNLPYIMAALLTIFLQWMPNLLGGVFMTEEELGGLGISLRLSIASNFPFLAFAALVAPQMAIYLRGQNVIGMQRCYLKYHFISVSFATVVLAIFSIAPDFMLGLFGIQGFGDLLILCTFSWWVRVVAGPVGTILMLSGDYRSAILSLLCSVVICVAIFVFSYPYLGVNAAGWALVGGACQLSLFNSVQAYRISGVLYASPTYFYYGFKSLVERLVVKNNG